MSAPLFKVYIDDGGELHVVSQIGPNKWDGKAFFLGYTYLSITNAMGSEIESTEFWRRLGLAVPR